MVLFVVFSVIEVIGLAVFTPAHDFEFGVVASSKVVSAPVPGYGHDVVFIWLGVT